MVTLVWEMGSVELEEGSERQYQLTAAQNTELEEILGSFEVIFSTSQG